MGRFHSQRLGHIWEKTIDHQHLLYANAGRAVVHRNYPEVVVKRDRSGRIVGADFRGQGAPDYTLLAHGVFLCCEAKKTTKQRWDLANLKSHQAYGLTAVDSHGGLSLLLLNHPGGSYCLPWDRVQPLWERWYRGQHKQGQASLTQQQLADLSLLSVQRRAPLDYLSAALAYLKTRSE